MSVESQFENIINTLENMSVNSFALVAPYFPGWYGQVAALAETFIDNFKVEVTLDPTAERAYEVTLSVDSDGYDEDVNMFVATGKSKILEVALSVATLRMRVLIQPDSIVDLVNLHSALINTYIDQYTGGINVDSKTIN